MPECDFRLAVLPAQKDLTLVADAGEIYEAGVDVLEDAAQFAQLARAMLHPSELGEQCASFFAAAVAEGFFQNRPQVRLSFEDTLARVQYILDELADLWQQGIGFCNGEMVRWHLGIVNYQLPIVN